jgi:hypothetical protein
VRTLLSGATELGFHADPGSFVADVVTKVDRTTEHTATVPTIGIYTAPDQVSAAQFTAQFEAFVDKLLALPITQKNVLKYTMVLDFQCPSGISVLTR